MTLHDDDERLHAAPDPLPGNWQENMFFICWDPSTLTGLVVHVQRAPGADVQAAQVAVAVDGQFASATFTAPYRAGLLVPELYVTPGRAVAAVDPGARREGVRRHPALSACWPTSRAARLRSAPI